MPGSTELEKQASSIKRGGCAYIGNSELTLGLRRSFDTHINVAIALCSPVCPCGHGSRRLPLGLHEPQLACSAHQDQ
jgi:hypothetical protein